MDRLNQQIAHRTTHLIVVIIVFLICAVRVKQLDQQWVITKCTALQRLQPLLSLPFRALMGRETKEFLKQLSLHWGTMTHLPEGRSWYSRWKTKWGMKYFLGPVWWLFYQRQNRVYWCCLTLPWVLQLSLLAGNLGFKLCSGVRNEWYHLIVKECFQEYMRLWGYERLGRSLQSTV